MIPEWRSRAACDGMDIAAFFPDESGPGKLDDARKVCLSCPVRIECLTFGIDTDSYGIFGGLTRPERLRLPANWNAQHVIAAIGHGDKAGTVAGWHREKRAGVPHCQACIKAYNADAAERNRLYRQRKALEYA